MPRERLEVADVFRAHGPAWRCARAGHLSLGQLKVMSAIEACRTAALGGHVAACRNCGHSHIAYNSCRNRHCPKCQGAAARDWLAAREAELLPVEYYHVVFTLPAPIADIAYQNKAVVYTILFKAAAETLIAIAADPKHLGARIGLTAVLHTWGAALTHHPHVHCIVPGGGLSPDGSRWIGCRPGFFLPVRVLSRLFRRLFLDKLVAAHEAGHLHFFGNHRPLADARAFAVTLSPWRKAEWVVYAKRPFAGPDAVLAYLSRYTHRIAISNSRLMAFDDNTVTFKWKDYRAKGRGRYKTMTLQAHEFIRRFPHPRPAARLPPHPALRAICQRWARREPGSGARTARRASAAEGAGYRRQRRQYANARPPMPLLRRTHGHHQNLRTQRTAPRATSDRTLMTVRNLNTDRPCRRLTAGHGAVLPKPTPRWLHPRYQTRKPAPRRGSTPRAGAGPQNHRHQSTVMTQQNQPPALKSP